MAEKDNFDTEQFIPAIQSRKAIWGMASDDYSNRDLKKKAWEEVTDLFVKEKVFIEPKNELGRSLQKRWKSLRDCYSRERLRLEKVKSGSAVSRKTQYVFFHQLSFLSGVVKPRPSTNNMEGNAARTDEQSNSTEGSSMIEPSEPGTSEQTVQRNFTTPGQKRKIKKTPDEFSDLVEVIRTSMESRQDLEKSREEDDDRLFLLSLLNPMKRLSQHVRFSVRTQFSQIIENASKGISPFTGGQPVGPTYSAYYPTPEAQRYQQQNFMGPHQQILQPVQHFQLPGNANTLTPLQPLSIHGTSQTPLSTEQPSLQSSLSSPASNITQYSQDSEFDVYG